MYRCAYICDFSRSVASLEHDADLQPLELHPLLQIDQLLVQLVQVLLVLLPLELLLRLTLGHELAPSSPAGVETSRARKQRCAASIRMPVVHHVWSTARARPTMACASSTMASR